MLSGRPVGRLSPAERARGESNTNPAPSGRKLRAARCGVEWVRMGWVWAQFGTVAAVARRGRRV
jgi:hypothetical protein